MDLYNHLIFAAAATTAIFACTKKWYRVGLWVMFGLLLTDLIVHIFISFNLLRIFLAGLALPGIWRDSVNKKVTHMTRKTRLLTGALFTILGALILTVLPHPYFLVAGLIITIHAYLSKNDDQKVQHEEK